MPIAYNSTARAQQPAFRCSWGLINPATVRVQVIARAAVNNLPCESDDKSAEKTISDSAAPKRVTESCGDNFGP
jgi:hypothetical protein